MADIIRLLPDFVANQIAAGEVIQRPASAVKELLENAIDAGAQQIKLIVKDSGRTLVQVIDDGCGMSPSDARMSFERHATSKIASADDIFRIRTKGFRGEALASIASVAQVELKTRLTGEELGTHIIIEGSEVKSVEPCQTPVGTSFSMKNLFFNVPARRQFLKSDQVELRHVIDEFQRVALAHPDVGLTFHHNGTEVYHLLKGNFRQRIVQLFGAKYDERLVPVDEETDVVGISGFVGKPEFARKNRGEQFFFVNGRFIKHPYLHHALMAAFDGLLSDGKHPLYFINLKVDPSRIDVNIHPTKTEVKFREEQAIYPILRSAVKRGLGKFQIAPTLDFDRESSFDIEPFDRNRPVVVPGVQVNPEYNPFETERKPHGNLASRMAPRNPTDGWREFYKIVEDDAHLRQQTLDTQDTSSDDSLETKPTLFQMGKAYIVSSIRSGMMLVDQQRAHERILYEQFMSAEQSGVASQRLLFPETIELGAQAHASLVASRELFHAVGLEIEDLGGRSIVVHAVPADAASVNVNELVELVLSSLLDETNAAETLQQRIAKGLARASAIKRGRSLSEAEMRDLIDRLFTCELPAYSPTGKPAIVTFTPDEIAAKFR